MAATIKDLGKVTAYAYAKAAGYTGTEEQFQAIFNDFTENAPGLMDRMDTAVARAEAAVTDIDATIQDAVDDAVEEATASAVATANQAVTDAQAAQTAAEGAVTQANAAVTAAQAAQSAAEDAAESFVIDDTLTVSGAAADAKKTGDEVSALKTLLNISEKNLNFLFVTDNATATNSGVTAKEKDGNLILFGTATAARGFNIFNGASESRTSTVATSLTLPKGTYTFHINKPSDANKLVYTYDSFNHNVSINDGDTKTFTADVAIGIWTTNGKNYGTEDNPTTYTVSAERLDLTSEKDSADLFATGDNTNVTPNIWIRLKRNGICRLYSGDYYIQTLRMPPNSTLIGIGDYAKLKLISTATTYAIQLNNGCHIDNVDIDGGETTLPTLSTRNGIQGTLSGLKHFVITKCKIHGFSKAGIDLHDNGQGVSGGIIENCNIYNCYYGIFTSDSEYNIISACVIVKNNYGIMNRGGNNKIIGCGLDSNIVNCQIDNDTGSNNGHGVIVGCTLNHSNNNQNDGYSLIIKGTGRMMVNGCQFYYGKLRFESTDRNTIVGCGFGSSTGIEFVDGNCTMFANCFFSGSGESPITRNNNTASKFINCYTASGAAFGT